MAPLSVVGLLPTGILILAELGYVWWISTTGLPEPWSS